MPPKISVVICCYNSSSRIEPTLRHLADQTGLNSVEWEIILVDNNSTDGTGEFASGLWTQFQIHALFRVVKEEKSGQLYARLKGVREAQAELIAFIDDDNWLATNWVRNAITIMAAHPEVGVLGGSIEAHYQQEPPEWIKPVEQVLACGTVSESYEHIFERGGLVAGAGCVVRKPSYNAVLEKFGHFEQAGRTGPALSGGDDIEMLYKIQMIGFKVMKSGRLRLKHFIPATRTTIHYHIQLTKGTMVAAIALDPLRRMVCGQRRPALWYYRLLASFFITFLRSALVAIIFRQKAPARFVTYRALRPLLFPVLAERNQYYQRYKSLEKYLPHPQ
jgi:glycosyltransferase involved in cell wall biosynthesis